MKHKPQPSVTARDFSSIHRLCLALTSIALATAPMSQAGVYVKADNPSALNTAAAWTNNAVPTATDTAQWDNTLSAANATSALGGNMPLGGIKILDPGAGVLISAGSTLTLGPGGIDMAAATRDFAMSNAVACSQGYQRWIVPNGRTLSLLTAPTKPQVGAASDVALELSTNGVTILGGTASTVIADAQGNPWVTYGLNDWAAIDASGHAIPVTYNEASSATYSGNLDMDVSASVGNAGTSSVRFNSPTPVTMTLGTGTATLRGFLIAANSGGGKVTASGYMRPNRASTASATQFPFIINAPVDFTADANMGNASSGAPVKLVKYGPGNLIITKNNGLTGGSAVHGGTLTFKQGASLGSGLCMVFQGALAVESGTTVTSPVTFNDATTNQVSVLAADGKFTEGVTTYSAGTVALTFKYNNGVPMSATAAPLNVNGALTVNGNVVISVLNGSMAPGTYPLIASTSLAGTGSFSLGNLPPRVTANLDTNGATIELVVTSVDQPITWTKGSAAWDFSSVNWQDATATATTYEEIAGIGDSVLFEDRLSGASPTITVGTLVSPSSITVSNDTKAFTISGGGSIAGNGGLTKAGAGTLTVQTINTFAGGVNVNGGVLNFTTISNLGAGPISFGGGTLQFASGNAEDISVRTVTFNAGGGMLDVGSGYITFNNPVGNKGAGGLTKAGTGTLVLTGTNNYSGNTVVSSGTLALNAATYISNSAAIIVNSGATLDTATYAAGLTLAGTAPQILAGAGTVSGTVISSNGVITPGTNGVAATLTFGGDLTLAGGAVDFDVAADTAQRDLLMVNGNLSLYGGDLSLIVNGTLTNGVYKLIQYSGALLSGAGSSANLHLVGFAQAGKAATLSDANANEIDLIVADTATDQITWSGTGSTWDLAGSLNWLKGATPWGFTNGDLVTFDDSGSANPTVNLQAAVLPGSVTVNTTTTPYLFMDGTGAGGGKLSGATDLVKDGSGTLILATANINTGPTTIKNGTLQVGNYGTIGDLGTGPVTNNGSLVFVQTDNHTQSGVITGSGSLTQSGSGTLTLTANNSYTGPTTIGYGGGLQVGTGGAAGSLGTGAITNDGTLIYNRTGGFGVGNVKTGPSLGGAITFNGAANVTLDGGNTYFNNTTINNGAVKITAADAIPSSATVAGSTGWLAVNGGAAAGGTLDVNGLNITVNALSGTAGTVGAMITNSSVATATNTITVLGTAGTTYSGVVAGNNSGSKMALVMRGASELILGGANTYLGGTYVGDTATIGVVPGGTIGAAGSMLVLSNGAALKIHNTGGTGGFAGNDVRIPDNAAATITSTSLGNGFSGTISGGATATNLIAGPVSFSAGSLMQSSNLLGTLVVQTGAELRFSSTSGLNNGGPNTTFDVEGTMHTRNAGTVTLGALTGAGVINTSTTGGTGTWIIGAKGVDSVYSGEFSGDNILTKVGPGRLTLNGPTVSHTGATTVSDGTLTIADPVTLDNSPSITLGASTAVLDYSGRSDPTLYLGNVLTQTLNGFGTINGSLLENAVCAVNVGLGTLTITNAASFYGSITMQVNNTNAATHSELAAASFTIAGPLTVTNLGPELKGGDKFQLFSTAVTGFTLTNLPALTSPKYWTNNLAVDGSIAVINPVNTNPPVILSSYNGSTLSLSWPDNQGWTLQMQTNNLATGLGTNWVDVPGSDALTSTNIPVDVTQPTVFYRLKL